MSKRALYVVGQLGTGGHVRTALTYASELRSRGWTVTFCGTDSGGGALVTERGFPLIYVERIVRGEFFSSARAVRHAVSASPDVIHSFDLASLPFAAGVAARSGAKHVHTVCGGKTPWYPLPTWDGLVVMSEELADGIAARTGRRPQVVRGRIHFPERMATMTRAELRRHFSIAETERVGLMISRTCVTKMNSLRTFVAVIAALAERDKERRWRGVICGTPDNATLHCELEDLCERVNSKFGRVVLACDTSFSRHAFQVLPLADVFMGVGDALAEAAASRIPALVVGETGYAGMLSEETETELYRFNLSGRNALAPERAERTAERILALLRDEAARMLAVDFAQASVMRRLAIEGAIDTYEELYRSVAASTRIPSLRLLTLRALLGLRKYYLTWVPARVRGAVLPRGLV